MDIFNWDIRREGRAWTRDEWSARREFGPDKIELIQGRLFWDDEQRLTTIAMLLEYVGVDAVVEIGDLNVWKEAVEARERKLREGLRG